MWRWAAIMLVLSACGSKAPESPPDGPEKGPPLGEYSCKTACNNLRQLGCPEAEDTPEGSSCEEVCRNTFEVGLPGLEWDLEEATRTQSCEG